MTYRFFDENKKPLDLLKIIAKKRPHVYVGFDNNVCKGKSGDDAVWIPLNNERGLKFIPKTTNKYHEPDLVTKLKYFQSELIPCFPTIFDVIDYNTYVVVELENVPKTEPSYNNITECIQSFNKYLLLPEDEWMKRSNLHGNKIIDFHRFGQKVERYTIPTTKPRHLLQKIHNNALCRYKEMGINKWKGKIYQGMDFDNGYTLKGYTSGDNMFDSYRKLPFCYMQKSKGHRILDLGCNEGFFSFQAHIHGASEVISLDTCEEDVILAKDLQNYLGFDKIQFQVKDAVKFVAEEHLKQRFRVVFLLSVLHQLFTHMKNSDGFLNQLSQMTDYLIFETPINHPKMRLSTDEIEEKLKKHFAAARLYYIYDAYSSGERAIYGCYSK